MSAWPAAVGPQLARLTWPVALQGKTLVVAVSDHALATVLRYQLPQILERLAVATGNAIVEIRLTVEHRSATTLAEGMEEATSSSDLPVRGWTGDPAARLAAARSRVEKLWRERREPACGLCGGSIAFGAPREQAVTRSIDPLTGGQPLGPGVLCGTCARFLDEPRVLALARRLVRGESHPPDLDETDRAAAEIVARTRLRRDLRELAAQAIADPALRPYLEALARRYLQLTGWEGPSEEGAHLLPEVAGLLGWK